MLCYFYIYFTTSHLKTVALIIYNKDMSIVMLLIKRVNYCLENSEMI